MTLDAATTGCCCPCPCDGDPVKFKTAYSAWLSGISINAQSQIGTCVGFCAKQVWSFDANVTPLDPCVLQFIGNNNWLGRFRVRIRGSYEETRGRYPSNSFPTYPQGEETRSVQFNIVTDAALRMSVVGCQPEVNGCNGVDVASGCQIHFHLSLCNFPMGSWSAGGEWDRYLSETFCDSDAPPPDEPFPVWLINQGGGLLWKAPWIDPRIITQMAGPTIEGSIIEDIVNAPGAWDDGLSSGFFGISSYSAEQGAQQLEPCVVFPSPAASIATQYQIVDQSDLLAECEAEYNGPCNRYYRLAIFAPPPSIT